MVRLDLTGERFGRLIVVKFDSTHTSMPSGKKRTKWLCKCDCGNYVTVMTDNLRRGNTSSCGCISKEKIVERNFKHGKCHTEIYASWERMKSRCNCTANQHYKDYGGRGIAVCEEWNSDFNAFFEWSLNNGWEPGLTIDRIDVNGSYEPSNCRWVTWDVQCNNKRNTVYLEAFGEKKSIAQWSTEKDIGYKTLAWRVRHGWSVEDALTLPVGRQGKKYEP